jgi:hypothetical protein
MKKLFLVMMAAFLIVATNAFAAGTPSVNCILNVQQNTWTVFIAGQKVKFFFHDVETRKNKVFAKQNVETVSSSDGYFYFMQNGKRVKYMVKEDTTFIDSASWCEADVYLNGKKVGHYFFVNHGDHNSGELTLNGKKYKMHP